jgi:deoxyribonuclease V
MILAVDVDYKKEGNAVAAGVLFKNWEDETPYQIITTDIQNVAPYESGNFYKRELPCILKLLEEIDMPLEYIVVDGYVTLAEGKAGLGTYLYNALDQKIPIIGVAKNAFKDISEEICLYRGNSKKPLYITSIGIDINQAKDAIGKMYGKYRIPTLLKKADSVCRTTPFC